jgi:hypothetical protein
MVPEQKRKLADFVWLGENMPRLQQKYAGKVAAIVNKHATIGKNAIEAYEKSRQRYPDNEPVLAAIPTKNSLLL